MRRKFIFITIFLAISFNAFSYSTDREFFSLERKMKGVKMIAEKQRHNWKTLSYFDKDGFLLREVNYYKNKIRTDYRYEYSISDTLLEIKSKEYVSMNNESKGYQVMKYYYNRKKQCHRFEYYSSRESMEKPFVLGDNFIYKDNRLQSYERYKPYQDTLYKKILEITGVKTIISYYICNALFERIIYEFDENLQTELHYDVCEDTILLMTKIYFVHQNRKQTDEIWENGEGMDNFTVYGEKISNTHIKYSNFDKSENWRRSYFMTEKGRKFRSKRKIEYW